MSRSRALNKLLVVVGLLFFLLVTLQSQAGKNLPTSLHHQLAVELYPSLKMIKAQNVLTFPPGTARKMSFLLHKDLRISVLSPGDSLQILSPARQGENFIQYGLSLSSVDNKVTLSYSGVVYDPVVNDSSEGLISPQGVALFGSTHWYPVFPHQTTSFDITVQTPADWRALVQGQMISTWVDKSVRFSRFNEIYPQQEIYLVAGAFFNFETTMKNGKKIQVLLRKNEASLAERFLSLVPEYIEHYSNEISPYPYAGFAVVENFWETGYGMPSFTLLGPTVIRLPFILNSSLPHEVLHNWWGNSVYVDYEKGNWSEGLTTFMADHWQQQKIGLDRDYRLNNLLRYQDFIAATPDRDFPLRQFKGRHNSSSQAVGYGKAMMFFRMLQNRVGEAFFKKSLQDFYHQNLFQVASYKDLQNSFEKISGQNLEAFFSQWLDRKGAPDLMLGAVKSMPWMEGSFSTTYELSQTQNDLYDLSVPVLWTLENGETLRQTARLTDRSQIFSLVSKVRPIQISVDPEHDLFRHLHVQERPATLSSILGSPRVYFYLDGKNPDALSFAKTWSESLEGTSFIQTLSSPWQPAKDGALVLVGDHEAFVQFMKDQLADQDFSLTENELSIQGQKFNLLQVSTALVAQLKNSPQQTVVWVRWSQEAPPNASTAQWASRLLHYGSFGALVFRNQPVVLKSRWPVLSSPLQKSLD